MMRALSGILLNTFRETVRQAFFFLLVAGAMAAVLLTLRLPLFTFYNDTDMYKELGLSFILVFVLLVGVLAAATGVAREVEDRTAQTVLSKSLGRWQFVVGKYLGVMTAVALAVAILGVVFASAVYYRVRLDAGVVERQFTYGGVGHYVEAFRAKQFNQAITVTPGLVLILLQVGVVSAIATALSTRLSATASVGLSLGAFVVGHLTVFLESGLRPAGVALKAVAYCVLALVPYLEIFNINQKLGSEVLTPFRPDSAGAAAWREVWAYVGLSGLYAAAYAAFAIGLGVVLFRRRSLG